MLTRSLSLAIQGRVQQGSFLSSWALATNSEDGAIQGIYTDSEDGTPELILIDTEDR